jgi:ParB family chromosome partitioning protein
VRSDAALDAAFLHSLREHGVLSPVVALRDCDGRLHVRMGQRRTLGAVQAGLPTHPGVRGRGRPRR